MIMEAAERLLHVPSPLVYQLYGLAALVREKQGVVFIDGYYLYVGSHPYARTKTVFHVFYHIQRKSVRP